MKLHLIMSSMAVGLALLPSESWLSQTILNPLLWAEAVGFGLAYIGGCIHRQNS